MIALEEIDMAMLRGTHICSECKTEFEWDCIVRSRLSSNRLELETIDRRYVHAGCDPELLGQPFYRITVHCPHCELLESFNFSPIV